MDKIVLNFEKERDTKNTVRFTEVPEKDKLPVVGTLYLQKWAAKDAVKLQVVIEVTE